MEDSQKERLRSSEGTVHESPQVATLYLARPNDGGL